MNQKKNLLTAALAVLTAFSSVSAQGGEDGGSTYEKFRVGGYGEMVANFKDYGINRYWGSKVGNPKTDRNTISIPRFVIAFDYKSHPNGYWEPKSNLKAEERELLTNWRTVKTVNMKRK